MDLVKRAAETTKKTLMQLQSELGTGQVLKKKKTKKKKMLKILTI